MPDTLKTAITLPGELETLTTADGSPMHIIGHATITLHLKNLRVTHHFIVVESLMTDVILGIDFQREYRISYDWDENKRCYTRYKGQFLCYTEDMESGINWVSIAKTIRIPPKHNGAISVSIKGHDIKNPTACFIGSQYTDTEVKLIDGVHDISRNTTLQVLVINNSNHHVNFPKGMKIGHLEPLTDNLTQIPINSATTQRILPETVKLDSFTPQKYQLEPTIQQQLDFLLKTFKDQFAKDETTIGTTPLTQMSIDMGDSDPVSQKPYPMAMEHYQWVKEENDKLLEAGVIRNSHSSWSAHIIVVLKGDGGKRLVIDYRALNKVTRKFVWPIPKVEDIFSQLNGAKYFSTLDLRAGYHHIGLTTDSVPKTAFTSPFGKYEYVKVPFGLAQGHAYFQEWMTIVLKDLPFAMAYLDDIIIYSSTPEEHLEHIRTVFEKLRDAKLSMKLSKCHFFTREIQYYQWVKEENDKLLEAGVIRNSHSSWSAHIIVVLKGDGGKRLVIDYRALNKVTRKFVWPIPKVEDIFSQLNGAKYFSTLDLRAGYHHIGLTTDSVPKTAFTSPFGKYEYVKVPFGLSQGHAYFQEWMTGVLKDLPFAMAYLDDIIIYSSTPEEHLEHIRTVFEKLRDAKLSMKLSKCHFFTREIQYLGHILGKEGIKPVPAKIEAIRIMYPPVNPKQWISGLLQKIHQEFC